MTQALPDSCHSSGFGTIYTKARAEHSTVWEGVDGGEASNASCFHTARGLAELGRPAGPGTKTGGSGRGSRRHGGWTRWGSCRRGRAAEGTEGRAAGSRAGRNGGGGSGVGEGKDCERDGRQSVSWLCPRHPPSRGMHIVGVMAFGSVCA